MNNPNPFVPKGSLLEQQGQRRSRLKLTVGCVLTVGVLSLVVMLIQGCKREQPNVDNPPVDTNATPASTTPSMPEVSSNPVANVPSSAPAPTTPSATPVGSAPAIPAVPTPASASPVPTPAAVPDVTATASTYEVVAGDSLAKIAKKSGVTLKALEAANPGVDSKKLKIKQKLNIPAATAKPDAAAGAPSAAATEGTGETYTVKSGDSLIKIAHHHGVTVKALRAANPRMNTDHIKVGDKLNLPAKTETAATTTPPAAPVVDTGAAPVSIPAPPAAPTPAPAH